MQYLLTEPLGFCQECGVPIYQSPKLGWHYDSQSRERVTICDDCVALWENGPREDDEMPAHLYTVYIRAGDEPCDV
jgi:hypothetical protein